MAFFVNPKPGWEGGLVEGLGTLGHSLAGCFEACSFQEDTLGGGKKKSCRIFTV